MPKLITIKNPKSPISEAYRGIRTSIQFSDLDKGMKVITVTSSKQNEGKTTVITNLATTFANLDKKVLVIDGDLRNPCVHRMFGISNLHGLTDVLVDNTTFVDCVNCTDIKNLHVLTCGVVPPNPSEMLASQRMKEFVENLKDNYDYIFIDAPPIGIVTDAGVISSYSDGCILVIGANETDIETAKLAKERLDSVGAKIIGTVLNKFAVKTNGHDYYAYYYQGRKSKKANRKMNKKEKSMA